MKTYVVTPLAMLFVLVFARLCFFTVDASEYVYVTVLGQHQATFDGADHVNGSGLKFGWPWPIEQVQRLDRRLQQFDLPPMEQLTHDAKGNTIDKILLLEAYVCWKIADEKDVDLFVRRIGTVARAKAILGPRVNSQLGAAIGQMRMDDLVNTSIDAETNQRTVDIVAEHLRKQLLETLRGQVRSEYGIDLVDIRLRRFNHPTNVRDSIFQRIRSERSKIVTKYQSEGELEASKIASEAEEQSRKTLSEARSYEEKVKTDADTRAMKIRNETYSQDPEFYAFLKRLEEMQNILGSNKTTLLLSTHRPMFESLFQPPRSPAEAPNEKPKEKSKEKKGVE